MNDSRLGLAAAGGRIASLAVGFLVVWLAPARIEEGHEDPAVFRPEEEMLAVLPVGLAASFVAILVAAILFARIHPDGSGARKGARFGILVGIFVVCACVLHNYVNLNIGLELAVGQAAAYFVQWTVVGTVIGVIYEPRATQRRLPT